MISNISPPTNNRIIEISEQRFEPLRIPFAIGNELYMITQQDVRNIMDTRYLSCVKLSASEMNNNKSQNLPAYAQATQDLFNVAVNIIQQQMQSNQGGYPADSLIYLQNLNQSSVPNAFNGKSSQQQAIAPIQTQLDWEMKCLDKEKAPEFSYCKATSTTDLKLNSRKVSFADGKCSRCHPCPICVASKGVNVSEEDMSSPASEESANGNEATAHELLKEKKRKESS